MPRSERLLLLLLFLEEEDAENEEDAEEDTGGVEAFSSAGLNDPPTATSSAFGAVWRAEEEVEAEEEPEMEFEAA